MMLLTATESFDAETEPGEPSPTDPTDRFLNLHDFMLPFHLPDFKTPGNLPSGIPRVYPATTIDVCTFRAEKADTITDDYHMTEAPLHASIQ